MEFDSYSRTVTFNSIEFYHPKAIASSSREGEGVRVNAAGRNKSSHRNQVSGPPRCGRRELPQLRARDKVPAPPLLSALQLLSNDKNGRRYAADPALQYQDLRHLRK